jgi:hypothetical protein
MVGCNSFPIKKDICEPKMSKKVEIKWLSQPEEQDYPAALSYFSLLYDEKTATAYVNKLKRSTISEFKAKDIFRASGLSLLGVSNSHVVKDQQKIQSGRKLSPLLLIRDSVNGRVIIADGYHRLCAAYSYNEDAVIPCKICTSSAKIRH